MAKKKKKIKNYTPNRINHTLNLYKHFDTLYKDGGTAWNMMSDELEFENGELEKEVYQDVKDAGIKLTLVEVVDTLKVRYARRYHPIDGYFEGIKKDFTFDEVKGSIAHLANHITVKEGFSAELFQSMFRKHLIRSVGQAKGEFINRFVFVFQHTKQNSGKSSFIRFLNPFEGGNLYTETLDAHAPLALSQNFLVNIEELHSFNKKDVTELKSLISQGDTSIRVLYTQNYKTFKRIASLWGSTNETAFLQDSINTRWIIIPIEHIDFSYKNYVTGVGTVDIHKVWAEALYLWEQKAEFELNTQEWAEMNRGNKEYIVPTDFDHYVTEHLRKVQAHPDFFVAATQISSYLSVMHGCKNSPVCIGKALKRAGHVRETVGKIKGYYVCTVVGKAIAATNEFV